MLNSAEVELNSAMLRVRGDSESMYDASETNSSFSAGFKKMLLLPVASFLSQVKLPQMGFMTPIQPRVSDMFPLAK